MKEIKTNELKVLQFEILKAVRDYCDDKNLSYFLAYGTLIGAVRHKGYIPWDDDIDIVMPRKDYDIFVKNFNGSHEYLSVYAPELDLNYYAPYANVCDNRTILIEPYIKHKGGVKIDIFPLDFVPEDNQEYTNLRQAIIDQNAIRDSKVCIPSFFKGKHRLILEYRRVKYFFHSFTKSQKQIIKLATSCEETRWLDEVVFSFKLNTRTPKSYFDSFELMPFEGELFKVPSGYDEYLRKEYGDYMQLPPVEEREDHHYFKAYWK